MIDRERGQFSTDVGNIIALIILIAIGAFVVFAVTGAFETGGGSATVENSGSTSLEADTSVKNATITANYDKFGENAAYADNLDITFNGTTIYTVDNLIGSGTIENDVVSYTQDGSNTLSVTKNSAGTGDNATVTTTLEMTTYSGSAISNVEEKGDTSFNLMTILVIVIIAAVIIGVVLRALAGGRGRGGGPAPAY